MRSELLQDLAIAVTLAIGAVLIWQLRIIAPAHAMGITGLDLYTQIYPMAHRAFASMRAGYIPLWNPFQFCGAPLLATVLYGLFYPLNVFFLLLPRSELAIEYTIVLHLFAAGLFMYLYGRTIRLSRLGALVAAVIFMCSGFLMSQAVWFTPAISAAAWLPLGFMGVERIFEDGRRRWMLLLAVAVAMPILAGYLQTWLYSMYALGLYCGVRLIGGALGYDKRQPVLRSSLLLGAGALLGLAFAAVQILPSFELQRLGPRRPGGLALAQILGYGALSPASLLAATVDATPGHPRLAYLGVTALLLAPLAVIGKARPLRIAFFWCLGLLSAIMALSVYTRFFALYQLLPAAGWFRFPGRILYLYAFAGAVLSGIGFDAVAMRSHADSRSRRWGGVALIVAVGCAWLLAVDMPVRSQVYLVLAMGLLSAAWCATTARWKMASLLVLLALIVWDLGYASRNDSMHPYHDLAILESEHQAFDFIRQHQGLDRTYIDASPFDYALMAKQGTLRGIYSITDYEPLSMDRYAQLYSVMDKPEVSVPTFIGELYLDPRKLKLLDLMSVRFIALAELPPPLRAAFEERGWRLAFAPRQGRMRVYENPDPLPRAYFAGAALPVADAQNALNTVSAPQFDPRQSLILEGTHSQPLAPDRSQTRAVIPARITEYGPAEAIIECSAPTPGYLVLTDTFYPGWKATVDGHPAPVYRANYLFRAVPVGAGRHTVTFSYTPLSFDVGSAITLTALTGVVISGGVTAVRTLRGAA